MGGRAFAPSSHFSVLLAQRNDLRPQHRPHGPGGVEAQLPLEGQHRLLSGGAEDTVHHQTGQSLVLPADLVEPLLHQGHLFAPVAPHQKPPRIDLPGELPVILRQFRQYLLIGRLQGVPRLPAHHAVHWQTVDPLEGVHRIQQLLIEVVGQRDHGQFRQKVPQKRQIEPHRPHVDAAVSQPQILGVPPLHLGDGESLAAEVRQLLDAVVDLLDLVPCGLAHDAVLRQIEDLLKDPHRLLHVLVKDEAVVQRRDGGVVLPDAVELPLQGLHVVAGVAPPQGPPRIGGHVPAHRRIHHQIDVATVVVLQNFVGRHALLRQIHAAPLGQATAPGPHPVAERGEQRLYTALPHDVVVENIVHDAADVLEYVAVLHIGLIVPGARGIHFLLAPGVNTYRASKGALCAVSVSAQSDLTVKVKNIRSAKGKVMIAADKGQYAMVDATGDTVTLVLKEVPEGKCKLYVYHDENGNYQLDREDGIPAENCAIVDLDMTAEAKTIDVELKDVKALQDKAKK